MVPDDFGFKPTYPASAICARAAFKAVKHKIEALNKLSREELFHAYIEEFCTSPPSNSR